MDITESHVAVLQQAWDDIDENEGVLAVDSKIALQQLGLDPEQIEAEIHERINDQDKV